MQTKNPYRMGSVSVQMNTSRLMEAKCQTYVFRAFYLSIPLLMETVVVLTTWKYVVLVKARVLKIGVKQM